MKRKIFKAIILLFLVVFLIMPPISKATSGKPSFDNFWESASGFLKKGQDGGEQIAMEDVKKGIQPLARILVAAAIIILLIAVLIIGIKYMVAQPNEQAELKKKLIGLMIATGIIAGAYTIWSTVYNIVMSLEDGLMK